MLIRLTKSNHSAQIGLLILLTLAFWIRNFVVYVPTEINFVEGFAALKPQTFLYSSLFEWTKTNIMLAKILAFVCIFLQAFWLNEIVKAHSLSKNPIFVGLIYVVLMSAQSDWQIMHPFLISNFFIIGALSYLFKIYDRKEPYEFVFNASGLLALASLISASLLPFGIGMFWIFLSYPINKWREWLITILGFGFPFFVLYLWASLTENLELFSDFSISITDFSGLRKVADATLPAQIFMITILVISLVGMGFTQLRARNNEVSQRKKITAMILGAFWIIMIALITLYTPVHLATLFVFSAFFIAEWFYRIERQWLSELLFYGFLAVAFGVQYL
ncbi:MAG: hypothetical protein LBP96_04125 [Bacteroidales bacterium]|jgi:hypothetical protein|nr:hypothetical protein [Bacteroidales bacterium]